MRGARLRVGVLVAALSCLAGAPAPEGQAPPPSPAAGARERCQLRLYTINREKLEEFARLWREGVLPLRRQQGFTVPFAWTVPATNQFVWMLCYAGPDGFEARDKAYYASDARARLASDPRPLIARAEQWFVEPALAER